MKGLCVGNHAAQEILELRNFRRSEVAQMMVERIDRNLGHAIRKLATLGSQGYFNDATVGAAAGPLHETLLFKTIKQARHGASVSHQFPCKISGSIGMAVQQLEENAQLGVRHVEFGKTTVDGRGKVRARALEHVADAFLGRIVLH